MAIFLPIALEIVTMGVEQKSPILTPGMENLAFSPATTKSHRAAS